ncbi:hypothetical protein [Bacillus sp. NPDC077027]|uniref:hypothetical protein n=1 Tax=Bacillus sp. NPDC077027 TaxID=3390548 RepID=UPI003D0134A1
MANVSTSINFTDNTKAIKRKIKEAMESGMLDVTLDMKRVASESAPHKTGFLERNAHYEVTSNSNVIKGSVGFSAVNNGFNYAEWTHNENYNLGEKSAMKQGGRSAFGGGTVPVGKDYLANALKMNEQGYLRHLQEKYNEAVR